jgi:hypothetical protein
MKAKVPVALVSGNPYLLGFYGAVIIKSREKEENHMVFITLNPSYKPDGNKKAT